MEGDQAGYSVSAAGDVNGDGIDDLIVGAPRGGNGGTNAGQAYVIYGSRSFGPQPPINGTTGDDTLTGTADADAINGGEGNDVLDGGAGADALNGGVGNDIYIVDDAGDVVTEGSGEGTDSVETTLAAYTLTANVEILEYTGAGAFIGTGNALANIIVGGANGDTLSGLDGNDTLGGEAGNDILNGGNGNDRLNGGVGNDSMNGGAGDDILVINVGDPRNGADSDIATGGDGIDTLLIDAGSNSIGIGGIFPYILAADIENVQTVSAGFVGIQLNALDNLMSGSTSGDFVFAGAGNDTIYARSGDDTVYGEDGIDRLFGEAGQDTLVGENGNDLLYGGGDDDQLVGGAGNDTLYGEAGADRLSGGAGTDQYYGGLGADMFTFATVGETTIIIATADRIRDFSRAQGDRIDVFGIDAIAGGTNDAFTFIGTSAFTQTAGQLRYQIVGGETRISGDVDGDGVADVLIRVDGAQMLVGGDFIL